jgi:uncharacterized membrane protein
MPKREFLTEDEEKRIVDAIASAENRTTGEIRVHIEFKCRKDPLARAKKVFHMLEMNQTDARNGVILYIATDDRKVAVYGDVAISEKVEYNFWQDEIDTLISEFKENRFAEGIEKVVGDIGEKLREFFPGEGTDPNELSDEITFEDNRNSDV